MSQSPTAISLKTSNRLKYWVAFSQRSALHRHWAGFCLGWLVLINPELLKPLPQKHKEVTWWVLLLAMGVTILSLLLMAFVLDFSKPVLVALGGWGPRQWYIFILGVVSGLRWREGRQILRQATQRMG